MTLAEFLQQFGSGISEGSLLALPVVFLAGIVASGVCPCTVPMGLGIASVVGAQESEGPRRGFPIAVAFFAGIVVNLTLLGALAGRLGDVLTASFGRSWTLAMALVSLLAAALAFYGPRLPVATRPATEISMSAAEHQRFQPWTLTVADRCHSTAAPNHMPA